jgi:archaellum component FlaF (FlaF/FlaG flagellin family)
VSAVYLSSDRYLLYYSITSRGDQPVNLSHIYFLPNGSLPQISLGNKTLLPGGRITGVQELTGQMPSSLYAVVVYYYGGSRIETKPVEVTS